MVGFRKLKNDLFWRIEIEEGLNHSFAEAFFLALRFDLAKTKREKGHFLPGDILRFSIKSFSESKPERIIFQVERDESPCTIELEYSRHNRLLLFIKFSQFIAACSASYGAVLIHGALASWRGKGVLLCGASGSGKTTASKRLPSSWRSLSDDATLLVRDRQGGYWAHPWPTWSRYSSHRRNSIQAPAAPVRLQAICFLKKSVKDGIASAASKESVVRLMAAAEQAVNLTARIMPVEPRNRQRVARLDLCCDLARKIPVFHLSASLTGKFWELIGKVLSE